MVFVPRIFAAVILSLFALNAAAVTLKVDIAGVEDELKDNVEAFLSVVSAAKENANNNGMSAIFTASDDGDKKPLTIFEIRRLHAAASGEIKSALQPFGYYDVSVNSSLEHVEDAWLASYKIDKGSAVRLNSVTIEVTGEGQHEAPIVELLQTADIEPGQVLIHPRYSSLKSAISNAAYRMGYLDGKYTRSTIEVNPQAQTADIFLVYATGKRYFFGTVDVEQDILKPEFVDKFVHISRDDPFETPRLTQLQLALSDSGYFDQVEVKVEKDKAVDYHVPITLAATPSKSQQYEFSLGYGTDTGPRMGASTIFGRINRSGHQFRTDLRVSGIKSTLAAQYKIPVGDVASEYLDFSANAEKTSLNDVESTNYGLGSSLNQTRWGGRRRLELMLEHETWAFGDLDRQTSTLLLPAIIYSRKVTSDPLFTRKGYSMGLTLKGSAENILADTTFLQGQANIRGVLPLGDHARFLARADYGAIATDNFEDLPPSKRFFAGGAQSIRGYSYEKVSPRDEQGNYIGGRYLTVASVEVDYLFYGNFGMAAFFDAGNVSDEVSMTFKKGAGLGFRYRSPVGMIRVDFAHAIDDPDSNYGFYISIGPFLQ